MPIFCAELGGMPAPVIPAAAELRIDLAADEARDEVLPFPFNLVEESYHIIKNNCRIALNIQDDVPLDICMFYSSHYLVATAFFSCREGII